MVYRTGLLSRGLTIERGLTFQYLRYTRFEVGVLVSSHRFCALCVFFYTVCNQQMDTTLQSCIFVIFSFGPLLDYGPPSGPPRTLGLLRNSAGPLGVAKPSRPLAGPLGHQQVPLGFGGPPSGFVRPPWASMGPLRIRWAPSGFGGPLRLRGTPLVFGGPPGLWRAAPPRASAGCAP